MADKEIKTKNKKEEQILQPPTLKLLRNPPALFPKARSKKMQKVFAALIGNSWSHPGFKGRACTGEHEVLSMAGGARAPRSSAALP